MEQTSLGFKRMVRAVIPAFLLAVSVGQIYAFTNFSDQIAGHIRITEACHAHGALVIPQLHYGGLGTHPDCGPLTSPSAVKCAPLSNSPPR